MVRQPVKLHDPVERDGQERCGVDVTRRIADQVAAFAAETADAVEKDARAVAGSGDGAKAAAAKVSNLFGSADPVGKVIRIKKIPCTVVGVLEHKGQSPQGQDQDDIVIIPLRAFQRRVAGNTDISRVMVSAADDVDTSKVQADIERLLRERRNIAPGKVAELYEATAQGDLSRGRALHYELYELNNAVFFDTNPIPMKYMRMRMGMLPNELHRLPMVSSTPELRAKLDGVMKRAGLVP